MAKRNKKDALGQGIRALLGDIGADYQALDEKQQASAICEIPLRNIEVNPYQPRVDFDEEMLKELSESIKTHGVIQPVTVRFMGGEDYQLIAGERRLRASKLAGLDQIPAYIRKADDQAMLEIALIENIQRQDLNPVEIAENYRRLIEECNIKHEEVGDRLGKKRSTVTNYLRLLKLPPDIQKGLKSRSISMGHARAILSLEQVDAQLDLYKQIVNQGLSVRQVEQMVRSYPMNKNKKKSSTSGKLSVELQKIQDQLCDTFDTKVNVVRNKQGKGQLVFNFTSDDDLNRILDKLL